MVVRNLPYSHDISVDQWGLVGSWDENQQLPKKDLFFVCLLVCLFFTALQKGVNAHYQSVAALGVESQDNS